MNQKRLDKIRRICDAATEGDWNVSDTGMVGHDGGVFLNGMPFELSEMLFTETARAALPEALDYIAELRAELARRDEDNNALHAEKCSNFEYLPKPNPLLE